MNRKRSGSKKTHSKLQSNKKPIVTIPQNQKVSKTKKPTVVTATQKVPKQQTSEESIVVKTMHTIEECVKLSVDTDEFTYLLTKTTNKIHIGTVLINVSLMKNSDMNEKKTLLFIVDRDIKTSLVHVVILDSNPVSPNVLFTSSDQYPITKLEKYIPSIVSSTQNIIKQNFQNNHKDNTKKVLKNKK